MANEFNNFRVNLSYSGETRDDAMELITGSSGIDRTETSPIQGSGHLVVDYTSSTSTVELTSGNNISASDKWWGWYFRVRRTGTLTGVAYIAKNYIWIDPVTNKINVGSGLQLTNPIAVSSTAVPSSGSIEVLVAGNTQYCWVGVDGVWEGFGQQSAAAAGACPPPGANNWFKNNAGTGLGANIEIDDMITVITTGTNDGPHQIQWPRLNVAAQFPIGDQTTVTDTGTSTNTSSTTLTDTGKAWSTNQWAGYYLQFTDAIGSKYLYIVSNTGTVATGIWSGTPTNTVGGYTIKSNTNWRKTTGALGTGTYTEWDEGELSASSSGGDGNTSYNVTWPDSAHSFEGLGSRQISTMETRATVGIATTATLFRVQAHWISEHVHIVGAKDAVSVTDGAQIVLLGASSNNKQSRIGGSLVSLSAYVGTRSSDMYYPNNTGVTGNTYDWKEVGSPADLDNVVAGMHMYYTGTDIEWRVTTFVLIWQYYTSGNLWPTAVTTGTHSLIPRIAAGRASRLPATR